MEKKETKVEKMREKATETERDREARCPKENPTGEGQRPEVLGNVELSLRIRLQIASQLTSSCSSDPELGIHAFNQRTFH